MTLNEVGTELKYLRYYYSRQNAFKAVEKDIGAHMIAGKIDKYNDLIKFAPPILYDIYSGLYIRNYTQEGLARDMGYTVKYIQALNQKLVLYFYKSFQEEESKEQ